MRIWRKDKIGNLKLLKICTEIESILSICYNYLIYSYNYSYIHKVYLASFYILIKK